MALSSKPLLQNVKFALDAYYNKSFYALHRFRSRSKIHITAQPPDVFGEYNPDVQAKKTDNPVLIKALEYKAHPEEPLFPNEYSLNGPPVGRVYDKYPFKYKVEKDKTYFWCSCGYGNSQPFCDGTHKILWGRQLQKKAPKYRPIKYLAKESGDVYFCNCKQSSQRPICDGTCKTGSVKEMKI